MARLWLVLCVAVLVLGGCSNPASGGDTKPAGDATLTIWGSVRPVLRANRLSGSTAEYRAYIYLQDVNTPNLAITDAVITVNGTRLPFVSTGSYGNRYELSSIGNLAAGGSVEIKISQTRVRDLVCSLYVPTTSASAGTGWTVTPSLVAGTPGTYSVNFSGFTLVSPASWVSPWGAIWAVFYSSDSKTNDVADSLTPSIGNNSTTTLSASDLGVNYYSDATAPTYVSLYALASAQTDISNYGSAGTTPSRIRIFAPSGQLIKSNLSSP